MSKKKALLIIVLLAAALIVVILIYRSFPDSRGQTNNQPNNQPNNESSSPTEPEVAEPIDAAAWLTFPGTEIDGPVMQAEDNEYYLRRNEKGKIDTWGCYFADFECAPKSQSYIIYGHSLDDGWDGPRFTQLKKLNEKKFAEKYHRIQLVIEGEVREYEIFSSGYADIYTQKAVIEANPDRNTRQGSLDAAIARSYFDYGVEVTDKDDILTLCTCTTDDWTRYVVMAKLVDVSTVENSWKTSSP